MKKTVKKLTAVVLTFLLMFAGTIPGFAGDPGWVEEITAAEADELYNSGSKCIIFFYIDGCYNCRNIKENVIPGWLEYCIIYACNMTAYSWPSFLQADFGAQSVSTPIIAFVENSDAEYYCGATAFDVLNDAFYDFYDITPVVTPESISLSQTSASLEIGEGVQLEATVYPSTADQSVTWSTSNSSVASVSPLGYVVAKSSGSAVITATSSDGKYTASCNVSVSECEASIESISIRTLPEKTTYTVGDTFSAKGLTVNLNYDDGSSTVLTTGFSVSSPDMSTAGKKTVTVTYKCYMAVFTIDVNEKAAATLSSISIRTLPSKTVYDVGEVFSVSGLSLTAKYSDGTTATVTSGFTCSSPDMSTAGTKTVTVSYGGKTTSFYITVKETIIKAESVDIVVVRDFGDSDTAQVRADVNPSDASYKSLVWSSSDTSVVTVDQTGLVTLHNPGTAWVTVTVTNHDGTTVSDSIEANIADNSGSGGIFDMILYFFLMLLDIILLPIYILL